MTDSEKIHLYDRLNWSHDFGSFLTQKFNTMKRFGLEGCESFIPGLKVAIDAAVEDGANYFVIGMPHRGRLNVLANVVRKPMETIMAEFAGLVPENEVQNKYADAGDVKYHLGTTLTRMQKIGDNDERKEVTITLLANPSHLEAVNPVVMGRVRA
jgi:2-oxoglutarate dehydrogenase E1 component